MAKPTTTSAATREEPVSVPAGGVPRRRLQDSRLVQFGLVAGALIFVVVLWYLVILVFNVGQYTLPTPTSVASELWIGREYLTSAMIVTLKETIYGFLLATSVGVGLAVAIAASPIVERIVYPLLVISNAVPKIALAPVFLAWFGLGSTPRVLIAALLAVFPIVISTVVGLVGVEDGLILVGRSTDASRWRIFWLIRMPGALPSIMGGLKIGVTLALTGAVVGQFLGGNSGLGYVITNAQGNLQLGQAFAAIAVLAVMGVALFYLIELVEKLVVHTK